MVPWLVPHEFDASCTLLMAPPYYMPANTYSGPTVAAVISKMTQKTTSSRPSAKKKA
jgi:hypothetical protein